MDGASEPPSKLTRLTLGVRHALYGSEYRGDGLLKFSADASIEATFATLSAVHHFGEGWSAFGAVPIGHVTVTPAPTGGTGGSEHYRAAGLGDIILGARYDFTALYGRKLYLPGVAFQLGLGLPSGSQDSFSGAFNATITTEYVAVGIAAFSLLPRLDVWLPVASGVNLTLPVSARIPVHRSPSGILFGPSVMFGLGVTGAATDWLSIAGRVSGQWRAQANEEGHGTLVNSGGTDLAGELEFTLRAGDRVTFGVLGRMPFYHYARGQQLVETFSVSVNVGVSFDGASDDGDDDDDDADDAGGTKGANGGQVTAKGDSVHLVRGGETFAIKDALVAGKVTVIDFWADWCGPCKVLGKRLDALAGQHGNLAVRKVEMPDLESPIGRDHLAPGVKLPLIWIYDPYGRRIHTLVGVQPDEAIALVQAALRRAYSAPTAPPPEAPPKPSSP